ncbi:hypothetical protein D3C81_1515040 [compost metagenome]
MQALYPLEGHVERTIGTGCGQAVAINHIGFTGDLSQPGNFRQCGTMFRVNRAAISIQQTGSSEEPGAIPHTSQRNALIRRFAQQIDQCIVRFECRTVPATDNQQVQVLDRGMIEACIGSNDQPQITDHFPFSQPEGFR